MPLRDPGPSEAGQSVPTRWIWSLSLVLVLAAMLITAAITPMRAKSRLEQAVEYAKIFGLISGTANQCRNLTLAKDAKVREAIRVYWRSETPAVREKFHEARRIAIARVREDRERACSLAAKTWPWMYEQTRDKNQ